MGDTVLRNLFFGVALGVLIVLVASDFIADVFWQRHPMLTSLLASLVTLAFAAPLLERYLQRRERLKRENLVRLILIELRFSWSRADQFLGRGLSRVYSSEGYGAGDLAWIEFADEAREVASTLSDSVARWSIYVIPELGGDVFLRLSRAAEIAELLFRVADVMNKADRISTFARSVGGYADSRDQELVNRYILELTEICKRASDLCQGERVFYEEYDIYLR